MEAGVRSSPRACSGRAPSSRYAIGSTNFSEFFVSITVFTAYASAFLLGHWEGGSDWRSVALPVCGLVIGALPAAFFGGLLSKIAPKRTLTIAVGLLAVSIGIYRFHDSVKPTLAVGLRRGQSAGHAYRHLERQFRQSPS